MRRASRKTRELVLVLPGAVDALEQPKADLGWGARRGGGYKDLKGPRLYRSLCKGGGGGRGG